MNFLSDEELLDTIKDLQTKGYDRIQLPGGTSKDGSYCSSGIIPVFNEKNRKMYFIGVPYNSKYHENGEQNGHTKKYGETIKTTLLREIFEETGLSIDEDDLVYLEKSHKVVTDRYDKTKEHHKHYFVVPKFTGHLHDFKGPNPIDGETAAPLLIPVKMFNNVLFTGHMTPLQDSINVISGIKTEYAFALM